MMSNNVRLCPKMFYNIKLCPIMSDIVRLYPIVSNNVYKDYDHSDSRYYRPGVFCLSKGLYIEVGGVFNALFHANLESEVRFLKFLLLLSRF